MQIENTEPHIKAFFNETELSLRWGVSVRTLQQSRWKGTGCTYIKIGRLVRYRLGDVEAYESARTCTISTPSNADGLHHG